MARKKFELCRAGLMNGLSSLTSLSSFGVNFRITGDFGDTVLEDDVKARGCGLDGA